MHVHTASGALLTVCALLASCGDGDADTDTEGDASQPLELVDAPAVTLHPEQPMVVDVALELSRPATITLDHDHDPGVRVAPRSGTDDAPARVHELRLRGLTPGVTHALTLRAEAEGSAPLERALSFTTLAPLEGFADSYPVTRDPDIGAPADVYRAFSMVGVYSVGYHAAVVVDPEGVTRWYRSVPSPQTSATSIHAGLALRDDGTLLFSADNRVAILDELGHERFGVDAAALGLAILHHDVIELPGGTLLAIGATFREIEYPDATRLVAGDALVEFRPPALDLDAPSRRAEATPEILWVWDTFDHLDPQRVRTGFDEPILDPDSGQLAHDWTHANAVVHSPDDDSLLLSLRHQDWIVKIDHASGEVQWRFGIEGDFLLEDGAWFFHQHSPQWQTRDGGGGELLMYDNGYDNPFLEPELERSHAVIYSLDEDAWTARAVWRDELPPRVSGIAGDADRLPGGSLLVLDAVIPFDIQDGKPQTRSLLRELLESPADAPLWSILLPDNMFLYRAAGWRRLPGEPAETG